LDLRHQLQQAELDMLDAEREWLTQQGPLRDAQLGLSQTRYAVLQQDLETLKAALARALSRESMSLADTEDEIGRQLQEATDPTDTLLLTVKLDAIRLRKGTTQYQQQANKLGDQSVEQERRNTREKQEAEHLVALVGKYARGDRIAQRLQTAFTRLRREQARHSSEDMQAMEVDLEALTGQDLDLEEQLYAFDQTMETHLRALALTLRPLPTEQREAQLNQVRKALETQKTALREQKQALTALVQEQTKLVTLRREYRRILEESDQFVLAKLFWLRDGQAMGSRVVRDALAGVRITVQRVQTALRTERDHLPLDEAVRFWGIIAFLGVVVPGLALWGQRRLQPRITALLASDRTQEVFGRRSLVALLIVLRTALWPVYLMGLAWAWPRLAMLGQSALETDLPLATMLSCSAVILGGWLIARALLADQGWMRQYWGLSPAVRKALQRTLAVGCLATWGLLVPRYVLLNAPGGPEMVTGSLALARLCFTAFQAVLLVLVSVMGRRSSVLMTAVLARSRATNGLLWRHWRLLYCTVLAGISTALVLDFLGYHYASRALWLCSGEALLVFLVLVWIDHALHVVLTRRAAAQPLQEPTASTPHVSHPWAALQKVRPFVRLLLAVLGILVLVRVYDMREGLLGSLEQVHLLEVGHTRDGQTVWLSLEDVLEAVAILVGIMALIRRLPALCEAVLFPHVRWDHGLRYTFLTLSRYTLLFLAVWGSLSALHMNWSSIQWIVAAVSVGVGFGLQEIVSNFVSGLILLIERPIRVDDMVTVGDQTGTVKRITIRATAIQNVENQTVIIPNKEFIAHRVTNWTLGDTYVRLVLPVGVAYGSDMDLVKRLLTEAVQSHAHVLTTPPPRVLLRAFGDSALQWEVWCFVPRPQDRLTTAHDLLLQINQLFTQHAIEIPFPQQDVHVRSVDAAWGMQASGNGHSAGTESAERRSAPSVTGEQGNG
jgi:potassium efflux system protein